MRKIRANRVASDSPPRKLRRVVGYEEIGGVCAGVAYWLGLPVDIVRYVWILVCFFGGFGILLYLLLWASLSEWEETPEDYESIADDSSDDD